MATLSPKGNIIRLSPLADRVERQRRKTIEVLLPALISEGVTKVVFESRGPRDDKLDRDMLAAMQAQRRIYGPALSMSHARGHDDPVLWLADILCGAAMAGIRGEPRWWRDLGSSTTVITVDARR